MIELLPGEVTALRLVFIQSKMVRGRGFEPLN